MKLYKEIGDKIVEIEFEARQPLPDDQPEQNEEGEDHEDENPNENYCEF